MRSVLRQSARLPRSRSLATASTALPPPALLVTTLPNGIRVATDPTPGHFVAAGVYVDAGSRYEGRNTRGAGHMVDRLGFKVRFLSFPFSTLQPFREIDLAGC